MAGPEASPMSAIVFEDPPGLGYILIKPLLHGSEGEVYLVRSLLDGSQFVLKDARRLGGQFPGLPMMSTSERLSFNNRFPYNSNMVPTATPCASRPLCLLYQYCNGGSLREFLKDKLGLWSNAKRTEAFMWHIIKEICKILAFTINGIRDGEDEPLKWDTLANNDLSSSGQIFVHWVEGSTSEFPAIMIGDWGFGTIHEDASFFIMNIVAREEFEKLEAMLRSLKSAFYREEFRQDNFNPEGSPFATFQRVYEKAIQMDNILIAKYIAENFIPLAERKIKELQAEQFFDLRLEDPTGRFEGFKENNSGEWVKEVMDGGKTRLEMLPEPPPKKKMESIMLFRDGDREAHLKEWSWKSILEKPPGNQQRELRTPWKWLAEADIPTVVLDEVARSNNLHSDPRISRSY